jgi:hypothetical protein
MKTGLIPVTLICAILVTNVCILNNNIVNSVYAQTNKDIFKSKSDHQISGHEGPPYLGVNIRGYYTSMPQSREGLKNPFPANYYDNSLELLSKTNVIDHVRYRFYWESYERDPGTFIKELEYIAKTADKYGIKVIYDNHQFHTSSWLSAGRGTGFPAYLFNDPLLYKQSSGGASKYSAAEKWWTNWWDRTIKSTNGTDGWTLQTEFLKKIVSTVDKHPSTLGYEILSEPQVHSKDQWEKIGKFNTFMTDELRKVTSKALIYSMNVPLDLKNLIEVNSQNMAKMVPKNKENVIFKMSMYGIPSGKYQTEKLQLILNASQIASVPLYIGEWNNVKRISTVNEEGKVIWKISANLSDISQTDANMIVEKFKGLNIWGMAYWDWSFVPNEIKNFNLVNITYDKVSGEGDIHPTKYFEIMKKAYQNVYG